MTTIRPTAFTLSITEYLAYHLAIHPRLRRVVTLWFLTHLLGTWSLLCAPVAAASTLTGALNWTGVTDSHGVPVGNYYLSVVNTAEAISKTGPDLTADPTSWTRWLANAVTTGLTHEIIVELLQVEAAIYIFMIATSLWLLRFAMSNTWLYWLATWFRPLFETIRALLNDLLVFPWCLAVGLAVGAYHVFWRGRKGHGYGIMLSTFIIGILGYALTRDPIGDLSSENGLIGQARGLGFKVAQAFANNGPVAAGGTNGQLQHLTGLIADATLRMPLQLMNFGTTVDDIGGCGNAYTAAILSGKPDGPAHAMGSCGAQQALVFAQHLNGANLALGLFYFLLGAVFSFFVLYVTYSYVMVCCAAFLNALIAVVAAAPAMIHGQPRQRALRRVTLFFKHALMVFAYTTYVSVAAVVVLKMAARGGYADQVGMSHPLARLVLIALASAVAIGGLWWLKRELGDTTRRDFTDAVTDMVRSARHGYQQGQHRLEQASSLARRFSGGKSEKDGGDDSDDEPLTGTPVPGRSPSGHSPSAGGATQAAAKPATPAAGTGGGGGAAAAGEAATPAASQAGRAATAAAPQAASAAATVVAPEVVVAGAVASHVNQRRQSNGQRPPAPKSPPPPPPPPRGGGSGGAPERPASGRAGSSGPPSSGRTVLPPLDRSEPSENPPAPGRQRRTP